MEKIEGSKVIREAIKKSLNISRISSTKELNCMGRKAVQENK